MAARATEPSVPHSLTAAPVPLVWGLFARHGLRPSGWSYGLRWARLLAGSFGGIPFRLQEALSAARREALRTPPQPPLFVIGHWRSGTTYLHNLLTRDPQFGSLTLEHCILTHAFLTFPRWIRDLVAPVLPEDRMVDNVPLGWEVPQEEEFATERMTDLSYNHCYLFPDRAEPIFRRSVLFEGGEADRRRWERTYDSLIRRLSLHQGGRRLCLKNPPNTARIPSLLQLYPDARFVFIVRHPEHVYRSTRKLWETVPQLLGLTRSTPEQREESTWLFYELLLRRYLEDRALIRPERLCEVRFEDLEREPLPALERIYDRLQLDGFAEARPDFERYLAEIRDYTKNAHDLDLATCRRVQQRWGFAFDAWGYEPTQRKVA